MSAMRTSTSARIRFAGVAALMTILAHAQPAVAETGASPAAKAALTVGIVDFAKIPGLAPPSRRAPPEPSWRTTFGSERVTAPVVAVDSKSLAPLADVDAVLIQGIKPNAMLRRLFPPRTWRLIVSRQVLSATDPVGFRTARSDRPDTTAIAVRARPDLRITARTLSLSLEPGSGERDPRAAATAVRLVDPKGRTLWLVSVALPASCVGDSEPCPARSTLDAWRRERLASDELTLVGGRLARDAAAPAAGNTSEGARRECTYTIESDLPWTAAPGSKKASDSPEGCISVIEIGG